MDSHWVYKPHLVFLSNPQIFYIYIMVFNCIFLWNLCVILFLFLFLLLWHSLCLHPSSLPPSLLYICFFSKKKNKEIKNIDLSEWEGREDQEGVLSFHNIDFQIKKNQDSLVYWIASKNRYRQLTLRNIPLLRNKLILTIWFCLSSIFTVSFWFLILWYRRTRGKQMWL